MMVVVVIMPNALEEFCTLISHESPEGEAVRMNSNSIGLVIGLRGCLDNTFPGDAHAGPQITLLASTSFSYCRQSGLFSDSLSCYFSFQFLTTRFSEILSSKRPKQPGYSCCSVAQSCLTLVDPIDYTTPGFLVLTISQNLLTHVHCVDDAIQPSHPLLSPLLLLSFFPSIRVFSNKSILCIR